MRRGHMVGAGYETAQEDANHWPLCCIILDIVDPISITVEPASHSPYPLSVDLDNGRIAPWHSYRSDFVGRETEHVAPRLTTCACPAPQMCYRRRVKLRQQWFQWVRCHIGVHLGDVASIAMVRHNRGQYPCLLIVAQSVGEPVDKG